MGGIRRIKRSMLQAMRRYLQNSHPDEKIKIVKGKIVRAGFRKKKNG